MSILRVKVDYPTIQSAINAASPGDIVLVENGIYNERITISTNYLKIIGENDTVLDGKNELDSAFIFHRVNGVQIAKLKIVNYKLDAICIQKGDYNVINQNCILRCGDTGINLQETMDTLIMDNHICSMGNYGIFNDMSPNVRILKNKIVSNGKTGVFVAAEKANSDIINNNIYNNKAYGIANYGQNSRIISNSLCGNNDGVYIMSTALLENNKIKFNNEDGIQVFGSNSTIRGNTVYANGSYGIFINNIGGFHKIFNNNVLKNNGKGILIGATQNAVIGNAVQENTAYDVVMPKLDNFLNSNCCKLSNPTGLCESCINDSYIIKQYNDVLN